MTDLDLIETERLVLSGWRMDQLGDLMRLHGDARVARYLRSGGLVWTEAECRAALSHWITLFETQQLGKLRITRKSDGVLVGRAGFGLYPPTGEPEIGYSLFPEHWGKGYATEAATALCGWAFSMAGYARIIGFADVRNAASIKILRRLGLKDTHQGIYNRQPCQFLALERPQ
jgi:RimJ/RimL family protein N-acetyltransferase